MMDFSWITSGSAWLGLVTLTILQVVLGVDNIVLVTILARTLPPAQRERARKLGVVVAMISRLALLGIIQVLAGLATPFAQVHDVPISVKSILLGAGGLFLIAKATHEMYLDVEHGEGNIHAKPARTLTAVLGQIFVLDVVFSLDQVITAVGLVSQPSIQVLSVLLSVVAMLVFVNKLAHYLEAHPSVRILALSFLVLIGASLVAGATGLEIPHGYIYFAMAYAVIVEVINLRRRKNVRQRSSDGAPIP